MSTAAPTAHVPTSSNSPRSVLMRGGGVAGSPKAAAKAAQQERRPYEEAKAAGPCLRIDWDGGATTLVLPWISFSECLRCGSQAALVFGNIEITIQRKRREAEKAGWQLEEVIAQIQMQKIHRLRDEPELGCTIQAFRLETNTDGETERHALIARYSETGLGQPEETEAESGNDGVSNG